MRPEPSVVTAHKRWASTRGPGTLHPARTLRYAALSLPSAAGTDDRMADGRAQPRTRKGSWRGGPARLDRPDFADRRQAWCGGSKEDRGSTVNGPGDIRTDRLSVCVPVPSMAANG